MRVENYSGQVENLSLPDLDILDRIKRPTLRRRDFIQFGVVGAAATQVGALPTVLPFGDLAHGNLAHGAETSRGSSFGRARSVIVMYCWGGMSHIDTLDMKPDAGSDIRGEFSPISTSVPGTQITEHLPHISKLMHHLALVRSVNHRSADHRKAAYWNLTGHMPTGAEGGVVAPLLPTRKDWPSVGAQVAIAMRGAERYRNRSQVQRVNPDDLPDTVGESTIDWSGLEIVKTASVSTTIVGPGGFSVGTFDRQDGHTNQNTVELIGMISKKSSAQVALTRQKDGPEADFSGWVAGDSTAGNWGSDVHGRPGVLWLIGDGEEQKPHAGFGCHANKFLTLNLDEVRNRHFNGSDKAFALTCRVGINGDPQVFEFAAGVAGVWLDGEQATISKVLRRDDASQKIEALIRPGVKYLTLAMLNGDASTAYDDIAMRDVNLHEIEGDLPDLPPQEADEDSVEETGAKLSENLAANLPRSITIPYPLADRGLLNGQYGGFLGLEYDPVFVHPGVGSAYAGVSPTSGTIDLTPHGVSRRRLAHRGQLLDGLNSRIAWVKSGDPEFRLEASQDQAIDMLLSPDVQTAFDVSREKQSIRDLYGNHVGGQSALLARRLTDAGVPLVTVNLGVGDLNGAQGDHWDTHGNNFNRLKNDLLPPWDRAASALLTDLIQSGKIDDTLVVFLSEFGRTPRVNAGAGRDHFPNCYSVLLAGAGVQGGITLGASDKMAASPIDDACSPEDIHATIFHSLGIPADFHVLAPDGRPLLMCDGKPLRVLG